MLIRILIVIFILFTSIKAETATPAEAKPITLTGHDLSIDNVVRVALDNARIEISADARNKVVLSNKLLMLAVCKKHKIYGINTGVGERVDKPVDLACEGGIPTPKSLEPSKKFNRAMLRAHSAAVDPTVSKEIIRATMLVRLNTMLYGASGARVEVAEFYKEFLNRDIYPVVPSRGSVGMGDIVILPHIGLAMMGEGDVFFNGTRTTAREALEQNKLTPLIPEGKDALSIISSNAYSAAQAVLLINDVETLLDKADLVFSLSLEGVNGNIAPFLEEVHRVRPYRGQGITAGKIRDYLDGSYLWKIDTIFNTTRRLQDTLSYRDVSQVHGATRDTLKFLKEQILVQINSSDDNPSVILDPVIPPDFKLDENSQLGKYYVVSENRIVGMVCPSANFDPIQWVVPFQSLGVALSHVSRLSCYRMIKLGSENFTGLTRSLIAEPEQSDQTEPPPIGLGEIQKTFTALDTENRSLSNPVSVDYLSLSGDIEDHCTNAPYVAKRLNKMVDNLYYIFGIELLHAAQAVELRTRILGKQKGLVPLLGTSTSSLFMAYREDIDFLLKDRILSKDIEKSYRFLQELRLDKFMAANENLKHKKENKEVDVLTPMLEGAKQNQF